MSRTYRTLFWLAGTSLLWLPISLPPVHAGDGLRTVALTGAPVPGAVPDTIFSNFNFSASVRLPPVLNNRGEVVFQARVVESNKVSRALLSEGGGHGLRIIAREEVISGIRGEFPIGVHFVPPYLPILDERGQTIFLNFRPLIEGDEQTYSSDFGIYRENGSGSSELVAYQGEPVFSGEPDLIYSAYSPFPDIAEVQNARIGLLVGDRGELAFLARTSRPGVTSSEETSIWHENGQGSLRTVARVGSLAPGTAGTFVNFTNVRMNRLGRIALIARIAGDPFGQIGVWTERDSGLQLEARGGNAAPGLEGVTFGQSSELQLGFNSQGHVSFSANLNGPGFFNQPSLWRNLGNGLELVARMGSPAPGGSDQLAFHRFSGHVLNARGEVAFQGVALEPGVDGRSFSGVWRKGLGSGLQLVAREGEQAPDTEIGVSFAFSPLDPRMILNSRGQLAFFSRLQGPGIDDSNNLGIWAQDLFGNLKLIARGGDRLNVSDDPLSPDWRTISLLSLLGVSSSGNDDGRRSWFNDRGELAFWARFTDGSEGIFVSNLVAVPEPQTAAMLVLGIAVCLVRRYRESTSVWRATCGRSQAVASDS